MPLIIGGMVESLQMTVEMADLMAASHLSGALLGPGLLRIHNRRKLS